MPVVGLGRRRDAEEYLLLQIEERLMAVAFVSADITLTDCEALFWISYMEWPNRLWDTPGFKAALEQWLKANERDDWEPGRILVLPPRAGVAGSKKLVIANVGDPPEYMHFRDVLRKIADNRERLGIRTMAMPRVGLIQQWEVFRRIIEQQFGEPDLGAPTKLLVEVYEEDVPGRKRT